MQTVYAVSSGEYSGYWVRCIFATREDAQAHADAINATEGNTPERSDFAKVQEFNFYPETIQPGRVVWYTTQGRGEPIRHTGWDYEDEAGYDGGFWRATRTEAEARKAGQDLAARIAAEAANLTESAGFNPVYGSNT